MHSLWRQLFYSIADDSLHPRFRWAVCQLDALQRCPNLPTLRKALRCLPKTLDETYERVLCNIPEEYSDYAISILQWLTFSVYPLRLRELAEVVTVNLEGHPWFDENARFPDSKDLLSICSSLVRIDKEKEKDTLDGSVIRLAHLQKAANYHLQEHQSHEYIASSCLAYLLGFEILVRPSSDLEGRLVYGETYEAGPLFNYAKNYWTLHARNLGFQIGSLQRVSMEFLDRKRPCYAAWVGMQDCRAEPLYEVYVYDAPPLWIMAFHGVLGLVRQLLDRGADINEIFRIEGGGTALCAASRRGEEEMVRYLLLRGAEIDLNHEGYDIPLHRACTGGYVGIAEALIAAGADVNHETKHYDTPLQAAVRDGKSLDLVRLLTSAGAAVKSKSRNHTWMGASVLTQACAQRSPNTLLIARHLLDEGADVNTQGGGCHTTLQNACARRKADKGLVELLLERGANINTAGGKYGSALQAASYYYNNDGVVKFLIEKGANINILAGKYGTALQAVCAETHDNVDLVAYMLGRGADVNAQGGKYRTALCAASTRDNLKIVKLLLKAGADTAVTNSGRGSALHAACVRNNTEMMSILLDHGADVNLETEYSGTPLFISCLRNRTAPVAILLKRGAEVESRLGPWGTCLQAALNEYDEHDRSQVVRLLLQHGAETNGLSDGQLEKLKRIRTVMDTYEDD